MSRLAPLLMRLTLALALLVATLVGTVWAQAPEPPDYEAWRARAATIEQTLDQATVSADRLSEIREELVQQREQFRLAQQINAPRIADVTAQLDALGPAPKEGESEAEDIATRRAELSAQLAELRAPVITATEAHAQADSLVERIDKSERDRQARTTLRRTDSPLLPTSVAAAAAQTVTFFDGVGGEIAARANLATIRENAGRNWLSLLMYLLAGVGLVTFGRRWIDSLPARLSSHASETSRAAVAFVVSIGQIVIPVAGILIVVASLYAAGLVGDWLAPFAESLPIAALTFFTMRWLARALFPDRALAYYTLTLPPAKLVRARRMMLLLAVLNGLHVLLAGGVLPLSELQLAGPETLASLPMTITDGAAGIWHLALALPAAFGLFRLCNVLRRLTHFSGVEQPPYRARILSWLGWGLRFVALAAPVLIILGYVTLANALLWPAISTIVLVGLIVLLQDFVSDIYALARGGADAARESLTPVLIGLMIALLSIPLFMLIWGARAADLSEAWLRIRQGVSLGEVQLSPGAVLTFFAVFAVGYVLTRALQGAFRSTILPRTRLDHGAQNAAVAGLGYVGIFLAALIAITSAGINLSSLALVAGALSVGIGFGLQNIVSNFVSGIILLIERPITVGDWIEAGGQQGNVTDISVRSTRIKTFDRTDVIVPNSDLISQPVTNWTHGNKQGRLIVNVGVGYNSDTRQVEQILRDIAEEQPIVMVDPAPSILFASFGADSLNFEMRVILSDVTQKLGVNSEIHHEIARRFREAGIEIPFAQRDLWLRNPEALTSAKTVASAPPRATTTDAATDHAPPLDRGSAGWDLADGEGAGSDGDGGTGA